MRGGRGRRDHPARPPRVDREWKNDSGYHRRSLAEYTMYRQKALTGNRLWARRTDSQATEAAIRVGVLDRMGDFACPKSVLTGIVSMTATSSLRSIYARTP